MPPASKITKQDILEVAFQILRNEGTLAITARRLAKELKCSTHPIYQCFKSMDDLYDELHEVASKYYKERVRENAKESDFPWLEYGVSFIQMAHREKTIWRFLYVERTRQVSDIREYIGKAGGVRFNIELANSEGWAERPQEDKEVLYLMVKIFCRGLAAISNNCETELEEEHIRMLLQGCFRAF